MIYQKIAKKVILFVVVYSMIAMTLTGLTWAAVYIAFNLDGHAQNGNNPLIEMLSGIVGFYIDIMHWPGTLVEILKIDLTFDVGYFSIFVYSLILTAVFMTIKSRRKK